MCGRDLVWTLGARSIFELRNHGHATAEGEVHEGVSPVRAFAGHEGSLAGWSVGGWRFVAPVEGLRLTDRASGVELAYRDGAWTSGSIRASEVVISGLKVLGARLPAIAEAAAS